jgi:hypothetical protein
VGQILHLKRRAFVDAREPTHRQDSTTPEEAVLRCGIASAGHSLMTAVAPLSAFSGFHFPREVITVALRWYLRYGLSYRDVEERLAERGVAVDHVTIYRRVQRYT